MYRPQDPCTPIPRMGLVATLNRKATNALTHHFTIFPRFVFTREVNVSFSLAQIKDKDLRRYLEDCGRVSGRLRGVEALSKECSFPSSLLQLINLQLKKKITREPPTTAFVYIFFFFLLLPSFFIFSFVFNHLPRKTVFSVRILLTIDYTQGYETLFLCLYAHFKYSECIVFHFFSFNEIQIYSISDASKIWFEQFHLPISERFCN